MIVRDRYGNALDGASAAARDLYDGAMDAVLAGDHDMSERFETAVAEAPACVVARTGLARARQLQGDPAGALRALDEAAALSPGPGSRGAVHVAVMRDLLSGRGADARAAVRAHVADHPRDAMLAQLCTSVFGLIGFSGRPGREAELLAYTSALLPHYGDDWWMLSQHAFSLCETDQIDRADATVDRALALHPRNGHAAHVRSHVHYEAGEVAAGRRFLEGWLPDCDRRALLHGHLSWHVALWAMEDGEAERVWEIVDRDVMPGAARGLPINVLTDSASILWRAELAGLAVPPGRWAAVSAYARDVFPATSLNFVDLHAAIAHAMAGETDALSAILADPKGPAGAMLRDCAEAYAAIARRDWQAAEAHLTSALPDTALIGGSRAQRDVLEFTYLAVLLRLGRGEEAQRHLRLRRPALAAQHPVAKLGGQTVH